MSNPNPVTLNPRPRLRLRNPDQIHIEDPRIATITYRTINGRLVEQTTQTPKGNGMTTVRQRFAFEYDVEFDCYDWNGRYLGVLDDEGGREYAKLLTEEVKHVGVGEREGEVRVSAGIPSP